MTIQRRRWNRFRSDGNACIVLAYSAGGVALMNTWLCIAHATLLAHVVMTLPWLFLAILSMLRIGRATSEGDASPGHLRPSTVASRIGRLTVPLLVGASIGLAVVAGSTVLLGVIAIAYTAVPWYRIAPCRQRPVLASVLVFCGGAIVVILFRQHVDFMFLPIAGWLLGMASLNGVLRTSPTELATRQPVEKDPVPLQP